VSWDDDCIGAESVCEYECEDDEDEEECMEECMVDKCGDYEEL
jgi:hypothetical protein